MLAHAKARPTAAALRVKEYGIWQTMTWAELADLVRDMACGLAAAGLLMATLLAARMQEVDAGPKAASRRKPPRPAPELPADFARALKASEAAADTFHGFAPSHRREYVEWILEAKRDETRAKRIAQAVEWLAEGKPRNWKYTKK